MKWISLFALGALAGLPAMVGCSPAPREAAIRDVRPLSVERGAKMIVEASGPYFQVGAPTVVSFEGGFKAPLVATGRAVAPSRVVLDVDEALEAQTGGQHVRGDFNVTVEQTIAGKKLTNASDPRLPFELDLFAHNLEHLATGLSDRLSGREVFGWLGIEVAPAQGGVWVKSVVERFEPDELIKKYDRPPLDGELTKEEARVGQPGGMTAAEWKRFDANGDGRIEMFELESHKADNSIAAAAGLRANDVITKAAGRAVATPAQLEKAFQSDADKVPLEVVRGSAPTTNGTASVTATIDLPRAGAPSPFPPWIIWALVLAAAAGLVALPVPVIAGLVVVWERKISAYMQSRLGPNRVGPGGWLQWLADGLKLIMKEDIIPTEADSILFRLSPYLAFIGMFLTFVVLPFSHFLIVSDLNIGLLFLLSVTSLVVVSIIMGGWSSNSKWALLGGMRSAAQIISYELPASVALLTIATLTGSLSTEKIVEAQGGLPWNWYLFRNPFTFCAFFIYFVSALAEGNRTPFDLPEAESELVSGYNTEYSGFRFSLFPMVEWVNLFVIGAVASMLFLGGWRVPHVALETMDAHWWLDALGFLIFVVKDLAIIFVIIWIRWTLPRFRVDQMMNLCWKYFIPISFACFVGVLAWDWLVPPLGDQLTRYLMFAVFGLGFSTWFLSRVRYNSKRYTDLVLNEALGKSNA